MQKDLRRPWTSPKTESSTSITFLNPGPKSVRLSDAKTQNYGLDCQPEEAGVGVLVYVFLLHTTNKIQAMLVILEKDLLQKQ